MQQSKLKFGPAPSLAASVDAAWRARLAQPVRLPETPTGQLVALDEIKQNLGAAWTPPQPTPSAAPVMPPPAPVVEMVAPQVVLVVQPAPPPEPVVEALRCTCGSGGHPRYCELHPAAMAAHSAELQAVQEEEKKEEELPPAMIAAPALTPLRFEDVAPPQSMHFFESHGYLTGAVLDFGGDGQHDYACWHPLTEDHTVLSRRWRSVVVTLEQQNAAVTLLAARGLLLKGGKLFVSRPVTEDAARWEDLFGRLFEWKRLPAQNLLAWQLTSPRDSSEQNSLTEAAAPAAQPAQPVQVHFAMPAIVIPKQEAPVVNIMPGAVQVHTPEIKLPKQEAPVVNIMPGALQVNMPAATKKQITMKKDPYGKVTAEMVSVAEGAEPDKSFEDQLPEAVKALLDK